jgi:hypothetical protein
MYRYTFDFYGGSIDRGGIKEKFLLFFLVNGREVPIYQLAKSGVIQPAAASGDWSTYDCPFEHAKLFLFLQDPTFGRARRLSYNFYLQFLDREAIAPKVQIVSFKQDSSYFFKAKARFLKQSEVLPLLKDNISRHFVKQQSALPKETLKSIITIDRTDLRRGVRHIRMKVKD